MGRKSRPPEVTSGAFPGRQFAQYLQLTEFRETAMIRQALLILLLGISLAACTSINRDIHVEPGETISESLSTVNGSVHVGEGAVVEGDAQTVNGSVQLAADSRARDLETVNGAIRLGENAQARNVETVNGAVSLDIGARVESAEAVNGKIQLRSGASAGRVEAVNGQLHLDGAEAGSLVNVNGGMLLENGARVSGELRVKAPRREPRNPPVVRIGRDCEVDGPLVFEQPVRLEVHETASIGEVQGAEPVPFSD